MRKVIRIRLGEKQRSFQLPITTREEHLEYQKYLREVQGLQTGVIFFFPEDETARIGKSQLDFIEIDLLAEQPSETVISWLEMHRQSARLTYEILVLDEVKAEPLS